MPAPRSAPSSTRRSIGLPYRAHAQPLTPPMPTRQKASDTCRWCSLLCKSREIEPRQTFLWQWVCCRWPPQSLARVCCTLRPSCCVPCACCYRAMRGQSSATTAQLGTIKCKPCSSPSRLWPRSLGTRCGADALVSLIRCLDGRGKPMVCVYLNVCVCSCEARGQWGNGVCVLW